MRALRNCFGLDSGNSKRGYVLFNQGDVLGRCFSLTSRFFRLIIRKCRPINRKRDYVRRSGITNKSSAATYLGWYSSIVWVLSRQKPYTTFPESRNFEKSSQFLLVLQACRYLQKMKHRFNTYKYCFQSI